MPPSKTVLALIALCLAAAVAAACGGAPEDPAERVDEIRSRYTATLNGFVVSRVPLTGEEAGLEGMGAAGGEADAEPAVGEAEAEAGGEEPFPAAEPVPLRQDAILDILVSREGRRSLPGITVDIEHVDAQGAPKKTHRAYLDTSQMHGPGAQIDYRLEDVDYEEGDGFHVEVRYPIPPGERGEYRELRDAGEGSPAEGRS